MEHYVASEEWAEKLKKAGWKRDTKFWWLYHLYIGWKVVENPYKNKNVPELVGFSAPLISEMLEVVDDSQIHYYLMEKYGIATAQSLLDLIRNKDEVAAMLCYLAEQGIVKF